MVLLEFVLLAVVSGTVLGVGWHLFNRWQEKSEQKKVEELSSNKTE